MTVDALLAHVRDPQGAPESWRVLFDRRIDASVDPARPARRRGEPRR